MTTRTNRLGWLAAVLVLAGSAAPARADLVLSTFNTPLTSDGFFNILLTNTGGTAVNFEGFNVLFSVGPNSVVTSVGPPSQQVPNMPNVQGFLSLNPNNFFLGMAPATNPVTFTDDPSFGQAIGQINVGDPVYTLNAGETINLATVFYTPTIVPNGAVIDPIQVISGLSTITLSDPGAGVTAGGNVTQGFFNGSDGTTNAPLQIGSIFIPEPTTLIAFAGLLGLGAVAARRRKA